MFPKERLAVQVRGCFWHQHEGCRHARIPETNRRYWKPKLERTVSRDAKNDATLRGLGWELRAIWECEMRTVEAVEQIAELVEQRIRSIRG